MKNFAAFGVLALLLILGACSGMHKDHDKQMQQDKQEQQDSSMQSGMEEDQSNTQSTMPSTITP